MTFPTLTGAHWREAIRRARSEPNLVSARIRRAIFTTMTTPEITTRETTLPPSAQPVPPELDTLARLYATWRDLKANRVSVAVTSEITANGEPEVWYCINSGDNWISNRSLDAAVAEMRTAQANTAEARAKRIEKLKTELAALENAQ